MAPTELMTWSKTDKRWHKGYMGRRYAVSPRQLKTAPTKEASRQAANDWWLKKQKEIDEQLGKAKQHPANVVRDYQSAEYNHRMYAKWQRKYGDIELAEKSEAVIEWLHESLKSDNPPYPLETWQHDPLHEMWMDEQGFGMWIERMNQVIRDEKAETAVPKEDTIRAHVDDYLATRKAQAEATGKVGTYETLSQKLHLFRSWLDPLARIDALNEVLWERFCLYLAKQVKDGRLAPSTAQGIQISTRAFIRNRWERRFIELPRNLTARNLSVQAPPQEVEIFTKEEVRQFMEKASARKRLYILLMLNAGMYPTDIGTMRQDEVDWVAGRITRKRTKTKASGKVPKVDYLLWRETFALLRKFRSAHSEWALLNANGTPLWRWTEKEGKRSKITNVATAYFQLQAAMKIPREQRHPLKAFRKTAASMLENHATYGRYAQYFLGHAPRSVADKHYVKPSKEQFDKAILWLGQQLGIK